MGVADGPVFAPAKPGSKPIIADPCACPECRPGPGLDRYTGPVLGELVKVTSNRWCAECESMRVVVSMRQGDGSWVNTCDNLHVWKVFA